MKISKDRLFAVALHQIGHVLGLKNCENECVMRITESVNDVDKRPDGFCPNCLLNLTLPTKVRI